MSRRVQSRQSRSTFAIAAAALAVVVASAVAVVAQSRREFDVVATKYAFHVAGSDTPEIHVVQNDLVHITFSATDIPHSFTIDAAPYRIMRKASPGQPVSFDFRADQPGRFEFFCNLTIDDKCREMRGTLVVERAR